MRGLRLFLVLFCICGLGVKMDLGVQTSYVGETCSSALRMGIIEMNIVNHGGTSPYNVYLDNNIAGPNHHQATATDIRTQVIFTVPADPCPA